MRIAALILFGLIALLNTATDACASQPWTEKHGYVNAPGGGKLVVERYADDGIIMPPPTGVQLRNEKGGIVARSTHSWFSTVYCPELNNCWALPYDSLLGIASPLKLDVAEADFNAAPDIEDPEILARYNKEFAAYFADADQHFFRRDPTSPFSVHAPEEHKAFYSPVELSGPLIEVLALSPFLIVMAHWGTLLCNLVFGMISAPIVIRLLRPFMGRASGVLVGLLYAPILGMFYLVMLAVLLTTGPLLYTLGAFAGGLYLGQRLRKH